MAALTLVRFWLFSDPYPPGLDGAQWLSYGRALFGSPGRSAESTYAPLVPCLAQGFSLLLGPTLGVRVLAASVLVLLAAAIWMLCVRALGVVWGSLTAALTLPSTAVTEPFFYGGYPQQAALGFGALGLAALLTACTARGKRRQDQALAVAAGAFVLASASHLLYGPLLLASGALVVLAVRAFRTDRRQIQSRAAAALAPAAAISVVIALDYVRHGYIAPLAVSQRTVHDAWLYATRESPGLWAVIVMGGIAASIFFLVRQMPFARTLPSPRSSTDAIVVGLALVVPSGILLVVSGQPRLAPSLLLGGAILFAHACRQATRARTQALPAVLLAWGVAIAWLAGTTTALTREFASYYQVIDASLVAAVRSIPTVAAGGTTVAADRRGWPIGWWVEALQGQPVFTASSPQWLAFPDERIRADAAATLLAAHDAREFQRRADALGVAFVVARKWEWIGWERWIDNSATSPAIIYDDDETIVVEIFPHTP